MGRRASSPRQRRARRGTSRTPGSSLRECQRVFAPRPHPRRILRHCKLASVPPPIPPARVRQATCDWVASAHDVTRGLGGDVCAGEECLMPEESVPSRLKSLSPFQVVRAPHWRGCSARWLCPTPGQPSACAGAQRSARTLPPWWAVPTDSRCPLRCRRSCLSSHIALPAAVAPEQPCGATLPLWRRRSSPSHGAPSSGPLRWGCRGALGCRKSRGQGVALGGAAG